MAFIDITTNNMSRELRNATTFVDNWAYVPGTSITGDYSKVYAFTSLDEFKNACGSRGPEGSKTFNYVCGLLNSGIPVLFRRIACIGQDTPSQTLGVVSAEYIVTITDIQENPIQLVKFQEKWGGTYGDDINISIINTATAYWLEVDLKYAQLEKVKLFNIPATREGQTAEERQIEINEKFIEAFKEINNKLTRIKVTVIEEDPAKFNLPEIKNVYLHNGADFDETLVGNEIVNTYDFIKDKILYQPKFLTSGGYTDTDMEESSAIASKMLEISTIRQDCRALIDLPIGTEAADQQRLAELVSYQQLSDSQPIPSASICAPWQYMQVGNEQEWMAPSYVFLTVVGRDLSRGGTVYTPKAGITNGQVQNVIRSEFDIGSDLAEQWQSDTRVNINPIMRLQGGRYIIAGNSTILNPESEEGDINAFQESSVDLTVIEIRRFVYNIGTELQYQYNSADAFETFSLNTSNFLDRMESEGAISDYAIYNVSTNDDPRTLKIRLDVFVTPTIKKIQINLNIAYGNIEVTGGGR